MAELADALDSKSSGATRAGSSPASGIESKTEMFVCKSDVSVFFTVRRRFCIFPFTSTVGFSLFAEAIMLTYQSVKNIMDIQKRVML